MQSVRQRRHHVAIMAAFVQQMVAPQASSSLCHMSAPFSRFVMIFQFLAFSDSKPSALKPRKGQHSSARQYNARSYERSVCFGDNGLFSYLPGVLIQCDPSIKAIILKINQESNEYIIEDLDDQTLVIKEDKLAGLKYRLDEVRHSDVRTLSTSLTCASRRYYYTTTPAKSR